MKKTLLMILALMSVLVFTGCSDDDVRDALDETEFTNESSVEVTVRAEQGDNFDTFILGPNKSRIVDRDGDTINFSHTPGNIPVARVSESTIIFTDPVDL